MSDTYEIILPVFFVWLTEQKRHQIRFLYGMKELWKKMESYEINDLNSAKVVKHNQFLVEGCLFSL
jgi:hypothetical protein